VARQYSGTLGKIGNCQVAVSLHYVTDDAAVPLDFALYLPEEWLEPDKREEAGIPAEVMFQTKWQLALDLIDRAREWGISPGVVAADAGYGTTADFRLGLVERGLQFAVGLPAPSPCGSRRSTPLLQPIPARAGHDASRPTCRAPAAYSNSASACQPRHGKPSPGEKAPRGR
jgi:SRSO17 transposase